MQTLKQKIINTNRYVSRYSLGFFSRFWNLVFILSNNSLRFKVSENDTCFISQIVKMNYIYLKKNEHGFTSSRSKIDLIL